MVGGGIPNRQPSIQDRIYDINGKGTAVTTAFNPNIVEPIRVPFNTCVDGKSPTLMSGYFKYGTATMITNPGFKTAPGVAELVRLPLLDSYEAQVLLPCHYANNVEKDEGRTQYGMGNEKQIKEPVCLRYERTEEGKRLRKEYESGKLKHGFNEHKALAPRPDSKTNTVSTVTKDNMICDPVKVGALPRPNGELSTSQAFRVYSTEAKSVGIKANGGCAGGKTGLYACPLVIQNVGETPTVQEHLDELCEKCGYLPEMFNPYNKAEITDKSPTLTKGSMVTSSCATCKFEEVCIFANTCIPYFNNCHSQKIYTVKDGEITIKDKQYPIKLPDGYYIIRKLTVTECKRLQTVPEWYEFPVSNSQAYKLLGNGWTCDVISHLIDSTLEDVKNEKEQQTVSM